MERGLTCYQEKRDNLTISINGTKLTLSTKRKTDYKGSTGYQGNVAHNICGYTRVNGRSG